MKKVFCILLCLLLAGCTKIKTQQETTKTPSSNIQVDVNLEELFSNRDLEGTYDESEAAQITLSGSTAESDSGAVTIQGSTVTIGREGVYRLAGSLDDGMILIDCDKSEKVQLVLSDASITSAACAPIYVRQADKVFITLEGENTLVNGGSFQAIDDSNIDAVIFSKDDLTLNGTGSLKIQSPAGHGIVSKDELTITGGVYDLTTASHGMTANDCVSIAQGELTIAAGKDGIHAEHDTDTALGYVYIKDGSFTISAEGDGISAGSWLQVDDGIFDIITGGGSVNGSQQSSQDWGGMGGGMGPGGFGGGGPGGGRPGRGEVTLTAYTDTSEDSTSIKAIKAGGNLVINGGDFTVDSADDSIHSNADVAINGGSFTVASGDDGFHADGTLEVTDGTISISKSYEGIEGLHIRVAGGDITLKASDDGLNAAGGTDQSGTGGRDQFGGGRGGMGGGMSAGNGSILISGGKLSVNASGDGIDANGTLEITGGHTTVCGPTQGDTATLDYDKSATITGGTFIGTGASGMAQTFSDSQQGVIAVSVGSQAAGTQITLTDSKGDVILTHEPELSFAVVILSSPEIKKGDTYTIQVGTAQADFQAS